MTEIFRAVLLLVYFLSHGPTLLQTLMTIRRQVRTFFSYAISLECATKKFQYSLQEFRIKNQKRNFRILCIELQLYKLNNT